MTGECSRCLEPILNSEFSFRSFAGPATDLAPASPPPSPRLSKSRRRLLHGLLDHYVPDRTAAHFAHRRDQDVVLSDDAEFLHAVRQHDSELRPFQTSTRRPSFHAGPAQRRIVEKYGSARHAPGRSASTCRTMRFAAVSKLMRNLAGWASSVHRGRRCGGSRNRSCGRARAVSVDAAAGTRVAVAAPTTARLVQDVDCEQFAAHGAAVAIAALLSARTPTRPRASWSSQCLPLQAGPHPLPRGTKSAQTRAEVICPFRMCPGGAQSARSIGGAKPLRGFSRPYPPSAQFGI